MPDRDAILLPRFTYGETPVPVTVSWTGEAPAPFIEFCPWSERPALCAPVAPGDGKPVFGRPHMQRQRKVIAEHRCDLCGQSLKTATKVSLSHARPNPKAARPGDILQVEPLLHKGCALISMQHCPSLKRDIAAGTLFVRQVFTHIVQFALLKPEEVERVCGQRVIAVGHAKVQLVKWADRDLDWLMR